MKAGTPTAQTTSNHLSIWYNGPIYQVCLYTATYKQRNAVPSCFHCLQVQGAHVQ